MREWFLSSELISLDTMPNTTAGISKKAKTEKWVSRKAKGGGRSLEYHLDNFELPIQYQLYCIEYDPIGYDEWMIETREFQNKMQNIANINFSREHQKPSVMDAEENHIQQINKYDIEMSFILEFDVQALAKADSVTFNEHATGHYSIPTQSLSNLGLTEEHAAIVFCSGDSMQPLMSDGDRIIVDIREQPTPVKDGIYVISIDGVVYVKRLGWNILEHSYTVKSENKESNNFSLEGDNLERLKVIGKAKLVMKTL
ncbi:MAG: phage repressor protein C with HTH and peptisase S24 domain [Alteromonadaceae bacterium]|jgi:phage repressor protein C with HTH and peptisase S24 domain